MSEGSIESGNSKLSGIKGTQRYEEKQGWRCMSASVYLRLYRLGGGY